MQTYYPRHLLQPVIKRTLGISFFLLGFLITNRGLAQDKMIIKPTELVDLAIKNSKVVKISAAQVEAAKARLGQSQDRSLPNIGISGSFFVFDQPRVMQAVALRNLLKGNSGSTGPGASSGSSSISSDNATLLQANASESVFGGFKNKYTIESDRYLVKAAELKFQSGQEEVVLNALSAYYNIYKLMANEYLLVQDLTEQNRRVKDFENLEKNGLLTRNDLLKAQVGASNIQLNLLDIKNALEISRYNFKLMLGIPESMVFELDTVNFLKARSVKSREEMIQSALENRADLQSIHQEGESFKARIRASKSGYYPSINVSGGYVDAWVPGLITITNVFNAIIGARYSLTNLFTTKHQVQEARANLLGSIASNELLIEQIKMGVNQSYLNYTETIQKIALDEDIINQANENYRILKNKYANSLTTLTDLLDGEISLLQARLNQASAKADSQIAYYTLLKAAGIKLTIDTINQ